MTDGNLPFAMGMADFVGVVEVVDDIVDVAACLIVLVV
jgi:uncharacterized protein with GYD domain